MILHISRRGQNVNIIWSYAFVFVEAIALLLLYLITCHNPVLAQQDSPDWTDLLPIESHNIEVEYTEELWDSLFNTIGSNFNNLYESDDYDQQVGLLINEFGTHGPLIDIRLCFIDPLSFMTDCRQGGMYSRVDWEAARIRGFRDILEQHELRLLMSKLQVKRFINDHACLSRYHHYLLWIGLLYPRSSSDHISEFNYLLGHLEGFSEDSPEYWLYARDFVLLVHVTGQIDRLVMADPEDLAAYYPDWRDYVTERLGYFELNETRTGWILPEEIPTYPQSECALDIPEFPFEDWDPEILPPGRQTTNYLLYFDEFTRTFPDRDVPSTGDNEEEN